MNTLRLLVEKWMPSTPVSSVRISRYRYAGAGKRRQVRVEVSRPEGSVAILFFRHDDGTWHVFPPEPVRLVMGAYETAP